MHVEILVVGMVDLWVENEMRASASSVRQAGSSDAALRRRRPMSLTLS